MRFVSILGDSVSTYDGYNPQGYYVFYDAEMQQKNGLNSVYDTWWAKVNQALHAWLCVNNSYSGSRVTGKTFPSGSSDERILNLRTVEYLPDIIMVYLGFNDFGYDVPVSQKVVEKINSSAQIHRNQEANVDLFEDGYDRMTKKLRTCYPSAVIICGTLMRTKIKDHNWDFPDYSYGGSFESYNDVIRSMARKNGCYLADISLSEERYETLDGSHPTAQGHITFAQAWISCLYNLGLI